MVGGARSTHRGEQNCKQNLVTRLKRRAQLKNLGVNATIILKTGRQK
jgi:hypothetical protein